MKHTTFDSNRARATATLAVLAALVGTTLTPATAQTPPVQPASARPASAAATILNTYTLPDTPLGPFQNSIAPGTVITDRGLLLGLGSDLWRSPFDPADEFWMLPDRGPNDQIRVGGSNRRTFPMPEFNPVIVQVKLDPPTNSFTIVRSISITAPGGALVTGLPNIPGYDETPYDLTATNVLSYNPNGLDAEGLARTTIGEFWIADEYSPSLSRIAANGQVIRRFVPITTTATLSSTGYNGLLGASYPVVRNLPPVLARRRQNRGFEGLTLSKDQTKIFVVLQSPLSNPNRATGDASQNTRIFVFDIPSEQWVAEYLYQFDSFTTFPGAAGQSDIGSSALAYVNGKTILVEERTDFHSRVYSVDLSTATNILGTAWDSAVTSPTLESFTTTLPPGVQPLAKTLVADFTNQAGIPNKVEGMAIVDPTTLAIANDNDFSFVTITSTASVSNTAVKNQIITVGLSNTLPLTGDFSLTLLHTNDVHGRVAEYNVNNSSVCAGSNCIAGSARLATKINQIRSSVSNTLLLDAGDQFQGTLYYNLFKSDIVTRTMNALGYDAMAVGNHEFDDGPNELARLINGVNFPIISSDIDASANPTLSGKIQPSIIVTLSGERVGIVGATTDETPILSSPGPSIIFSPVMTAVKNAVNNLTAQGVDKIILLGHLGYDVDISLAKVITGIDVIVGGHSHTFLASPVITQANGDVPLGPYPTLVTAPDGNTVVIVQAGQWGRYLGNISVNFSPTGTVSAWNGAPIYMGNSIPQDPAVLSIITPTYTSQVNAIRATLVGTSTVPMPENGATGGRECRFRECLLGNFVADALLWKINQEAPAGQKYDFAITNGGGLRAPLALSNTISLGDVLETLPFGNTIATFSITGTEIIKALENGVSRVAAGGGGFPQISGLRFTWNPSATVGSRIISVQVAVPASSTVSALGIGAGPVITTYVPLSPTKIYRVATNNFTRIGGDGYIVFATQAIDPYDFGPSLDEAVTEYLQQFSPITPMIEGRILALAERKYFPIISRALGDSQ